MQILAGLSLALAAALAVQAADRKDDSSHLKVMVPATLNKYFSVDSVQATPQGSIYHSQALFGMPRYGGDKKIVGEVFYVTPGDKVDGCDFTANVGDSSNTKIFLVDRGACDFVDKVRKAQSQGAAAVIIADNVCQCDSIGDDWPTNFPIGRTKDLQKKCAALADASRDRLGQANCENGLPYMADDGHGAEVNIPSFLISFLDAQVIKDCISNDKNTLSGFTCNKDQKVILSLEWDLAQLSTVKWDLWSSSDTEGAFKKAFAPLQSKLEGKTDFSPRYFIWDGVNWGCDVDNVCGSQCVEGGKYCNPDSDTGIKGKEIVEENLRQLCVWHSNPGNNHQAWWDYVSKFATDCHPATREDAYKFSEACSKQTHTALGLDYTKTDKCVKESWDSQHLNNQMLDNELNDRAKLKILQLPTAIVNTQLLRGGVTATTVLSSLCAGYLPNTAPQICTCVNSLTSADTLDSCLTISMCPKSTDIYCSKNKQCYSAQEYDDKCACFAGQKYCSSLQQCVPETRFDSDCPSCSSAKPVYCPASGECVTKMMECRSPDAGSGTSMTQVFVIIFLVVLAAGGIGFRYWKRQQARLHDDVRAILESYRALDQESDEGQAMMMPKRGGNGEINNGDAATII